MIVEPGFFDHPKTLELIRRTGDAAAPIMVMRLWGFCQLRRQWKFAKMRDSYLASICGWKHEPLELKAILVEIGFLEVKGTLTIVHDWEKANAKLVSCWRNGTKGGRPIVITRKPKANPSKTQGQPTGTHLSSLSSLSNLVQSSLSSLEGDSKRKPKDQAEVEAYCQKQGLPCSDGEAMWLHWQEKGMAKVKDWRLTIQKWKSFGYLPSQKNRPRPASSQLEFDETGRRKSAQQLKEDRAYEAHRKERETNDNQRTGC
jgi:hypothetical protein